VVVNTCQDEDGIGSEALYTANAPLDHLNHSVQVTHKNMETVRISPDSHSNTKDLLLVVDAETLSSARNLRTQPM
jgi:hypothetical protein